MCTDLMNNDFYLQSCDRVILMTSPNLNYFIIAGALLMLGSIYIGVLPTTEEQVAHAQCIVSTLLLIGRYYSTAVYYYWHMSVN